MLTLLFSSRSEIKGSARWMDQVTKSNSNHCICFLRRILLAENSPLSLEDMAALTLDDEVVPKYYDGSPVKDCVGCPVTRKYNGFNGTPRKISKVDVARFNHGHRPRLALMNNNNSSSELPFERHQNPQGGFQSIFA